MSEKREDIFREGTAGQPLEDRALKSAARLFGEELMPLLGIREKVRRIAPTEEISLNPQDYLQDFNYEMTDGSWTHIEFESDSIRTEDLRRFRSYEAVTSYHHGVDVTTCVLCSSQVKKPLDCLKTGMNTYRIKVLRMKDKDADQILRELERRQKDGRLERSELLEILLTPLMSGEMPQQERIIRGFRLLKQEREHRKREELAQMEAVLYVLAAKFLKTEQLKEIKEMMNMTVLGEMIMQDGIAIGEARGIKLGEARGKDSVNRLNAVLIEQNRLDDLKRATEDRDYQRKLMTELLSGKE